jgi:L-fuconolactonase
MKIDAEVHFWKYEKNISNPLIRNNKLLQQHYLPDQITLSLNRNGIDGCIAVVAEHTAVETRFLSELALTHPEIRGVIGWIDLYDSETANNIREFQQYAPIRGYLTEALRDRRPTLPVMELLHENQYSLDLSIGHESDPDVLNWMNDYPDQQFVLQDCGNPDAKQPPSAAWKTIIRELAKHQNLSCKVSGLFIHSNWRSWKPADFYPFLEILFEAFGPERILYASDWPFMLLAGIYVQWKSLLEKFTENWSPEHRDKFFGENAKRIYRI